MNSRHILFTGSSLFLRKSFKIYAAARQLALRSFFAAPFPLSAASSSSSMTRTARKALGSSPSPHTALRAPGRV